MPKFDGTGPCGCCSSMGRGRGGCLGMQDGKCCRLLSRRDRCRLTAAEETSIKREQIEVIKAHKERLEAEINKLEKEITK